MTTPDTDEAKGSDHFVMDKWMTWEGAVEILIVMIEDGSALAKHHAKEELKRMARIADKHFPEGTPS